MRDYAIALGLIAGVAAGVKYIRDQRRRRDYEGIACTDCGKFGHGYMLKDEIWAEATSDPWILLCPRCVERRIGRRLTFDDFTKYPINWPIRFAYMMGRREVGGLH